MLALIICWSPLKSVAYLAPFICLGWYLVKSNSGVALRRMVIVLSVAMLIITFYYILYRTADEYFLVGNALVALITYASFIFLLAVPTSPYREEHHYLRYAKVIEVVVIIEGVVGMLQYFAAATTSISQTDAVQGTISPFSFTAEFAGFGNQMFAINIILLLLFLLPYLLVHKRGKFAYAIGLAALLMSSVVHVFFALLASLAIGSFYFRQHLLFSQFKILLSALVAVILLVGALAVYQPNVIRNIGMYYTIYSEGDSPKNVIINASTERLPREFPLVSIFGLGPGQYSSRAGLISSGFYFTGLKSNEKMSFLPNQMSPYFVKYVLPTWHLYEGNNAKYGNSTMSRPFFSLLSMYIEFGAVAIVLMLVYAGYLMSRLRTAFILSFNEEEPLRRYLSMVCGMAILFVMFLALFENYLETTQAIFPGLVLVKIFFPTSNQVAPEPTADSTRHATA